MAARRNLNYPRRLVSLGDVPVVARRSVSTRGAFNWGLRVERSETANLKYRPDVDGLRAVAVLAVVLYHTQLGISGGYVGVDVFFVISGYLITGLVIKDLDAGRFSLAGFWERRVRRILPALAVMVAAVLGVGYVLLLPSDLEKLGESAIAQGSLVANVYFWRDVDYFGGRAELKPLLHTWSLAVEEQFYLVFPLFLMLIGGIGRARRFAVLTILAFASLVLCVYASYFYPGANFYLLPPRAWELLLGGMLATAPAANPRRSTGEIISWIGLGSILASVVFYDPTTRFPGLAALPPCLGTAAVIYANSNRLSSVGRFLATAPMTFVGLISYSLYLWHWPVIVYIRYLNLTLDWQLSVLAVTLSFLFAILSWWFVERPFRHRGQASERRKVFGTAALVMGLLLAVSTVFWRSDGLPGRYSGDSAGLLEDATWTGRDFQRSLPDIAEGRIPLLGESSDHAEPGSFILWGDSHGLMLTDVVDQLAREHNVSGYGAVSAACCPLPGAWNQFSQESPEDQLKRNEAFLKFIVEKQVKNVLLVARWSFYTEGWSGAEHALRYTDKSQVGSALVDSPNHRPSPEESAEVLQRHLNVLIAKLVDAGVKVWILKQVPEQDVPIAAQLLKRKRAHIAAPINSVTIESYRQRQAGVDRVFAQLPAGVEILDPTSHFFDRFGEGVITVDGRACYKDLDHLSKFGANELVRPVLEPVFAAIAESDAARSVVRIPTGSAKAGAVESE